MNNAGIVTFGIPLMASWVAKDWSRVCRHLGATLGSIYAQTDPNFRIIVAGTDRPELSIPIDERFEFITCTQLKPMSSDALINDGVLKRQRVAMRLRELGGGYLMLTDADDLVSDKLVAYVRRDRDPNGYLVTDGYMFDAGRGYFAPFPFPDSPPDMHFFQECATCSMPFLVAEELPASLDDVNNRYGKLMALGHPFVGAHAIAEGRPLKPFPERFSCYVRNTGENLSAADAAMNSPGRIPLQVYLNDQVESARVRRTPALNDEFNLEAAEDAAHAPRAARRHEGSVGLSVLISTYRRPAGLHRLLTALRPQVEKKSNREIVVVNDGSHNDAYAKVIEEFADIIRYFPLPQNGGVAAARNATLAACWGTYAVFTDDDCEPPEWWLDWLSARLSAHPEIDVMVGTTTPHWVTRNFRERLQGTWFIPRPWRIGTRDIFATANVAIRSDLLRKVGGFGFSEFAGAGEDTELSLRLHRAHARFLVDHSWTVKHDVNTTYKSLGSKFRSYGYANATISRIAAVEIPPPAGIGGAVNRLNGFPALFRAHRYMAYGFEGGRLSQTAAALTAAWIQSRYVAGFTSPRRPA